MKNVTLTILSITMITFFSCSEVTGELKYMNELKKSISEKYETEKVEINIKNNNELIISLIDSKFDDYSSDQKQQISRDIGILSQKLREDKEKIKNGEVRFLNQENYGIIKSNSSETFQMFD